MKKKNILFLITLFMGTSAIYTRLNQEEIQKKAEQLLKEHPNANEHTDFILLRGMGVPIADINQVRIAYQKLQTEQNARAAEENKPSKLSSDTFMNFENNISQKPNVEPLDTNLIAQKIANELPSNAGFKAIVDKIKEYNITDMRAKTDIKATVEQLLKTKKEEPVIPSFEPLTQQQSTPQQITASNQSELNNKAIENAAREEVNELLKLLEQNENAKNKFIEITTFKILNSINILWTDLYVYFQLTGDSRPERGIKQHAYDWMKQNHNFAIYVPSLLLAR